MAYIFHYVRSPLEIMCIAFLVLLLENTKLFYILLLFCLYIEILAVSSLFKCLIAIKCLESRVETLQIFYLFISFLAKWNFFTVTNIGEFCQKYHRDFQSIETVINGPYNTRKSWISDAFYAISF